MGGDQSSGTVLTRPFSSVPDAAFGCMWTRMLTNFNSGANEDDGTCVYACDYPATQLMIEASSTGDVSRSGFSNGQASGEVTGGKAE